LTEQTPTYAATFAANVLGTLQSLMRCA